MSNSDEAPDPRALIEENRELRREVLGLRQFIDSMQSLMDIVEAAGPDGALIDLLGAILANVRKTITAAAGSLLVLEEDTGELVFVLAQGSVPGESLVGRRLRRGEGIAGWVAAQRRATVVNDVHADDRFFGDVDKEVEFNTRTILAAPIVGGGQVLGVIELLNKEGGALFSIGDQTLLSLMCRFSGELLYTLIRRDKDLG
jgi:sigma-B regulation protein RsbU (phosphoserine phosphatase)